MKYKKFGKLDFKKLHPAGSLGAQLKTVEDVMITGSKIPFVNENLKMDEALKILSKKKLGVLIVVNSKYKTKCRIQRRHAIMTDLVSARKLGSPYVAK